LNLGFCLLSISAQLSNVKTELAPLPLLPFALESCRASSSYHLVFLNAFHAFLLSALQMLFCSSIFFHAVLVCCCSKLCLQLGFLMSHPPPPLFSCCKLCELYNYHPRFNKWNSCMSHTNLHVMTYISIALVKKIKFFAHKKFTVQFLPTSENSLNLMSKLRSFFFLSS
jgi:hypothetical protein